MTLDKYRKLNPYNKQKIAYKHKYYTLSSDKTSVICLGNTLLYHEYERQVRKQIKNTSSRYKDKFSKYGILDKNLTITEYQTLCQDIKDYNKDYAIMSKKRQLLKKLDKELPQIDNPFTVIRHEKKAGKVYTNVKYTQPRQTLDILVGSKKAHILRLLDKLSCKGKVKLKATNMSIFCKFTLVK